MVAFGGFVQKHLHVPSSTNFFKRGEKKRMVTKMYVKSWTEDFPCSHHFELAHILAESRSRILRSLLIVRVCLVQNTAARAFVSGYLYPILTFEYMRDTNKCSTVGYLQRRYIRDMYSHDSHGGMAIANYGKHSFAMFEFGA